MGPDLPSSSQAATWLSKDNWLSSPTPQPSIRRAAGSSPLTWAWQHSRRQIEEEPHNAESSLSLIDATTNAIASHNRTPALTGSEQPLIDLENVPMIDDFDTPSSPPRSPGLAPAADAHPSIGDRRGPSHMMGELTPSHMLLFQPHDNPSSYTSQAQKNL